MREFYFYFVTDILQDFSVFGLGLFVYTCILCSLKSFGVPYTAPYSPVTGAGKNSFFLNPTWQREKRSDFLDTKRHDRQEPISMKWRYK